MTAVVPANADVDVESAVKAMTVKQKREAMVETEARLETVERALERIQAVVAKEQRADNQNHHDFERAIVAMGASAETFTREAIAAEADVRRAAMQLKGVLERHEQVEQRTSYGLYERWRRRLDAHLCAGGAVERRNDVEAFISVRHGYMPQDEFDQELQQEKSAQKKRDAVAEDLHTSWGRVAVLRDEVRKAELQRAGLAHEICEQKKRATEWWEWHLSRVPGQCSAMEWSRQAEAVIANLQVECRTSHLHCEALGRQEEATEAEAKRARRLVEAQEFQIRRYLGYSEAYANQAAALHAETAPRGSDDERIAEVRRSTRRLEKAQRIRDELAVEQREARCLEAESADRRRDIAPLLRTRREELNDATRHLEMLREQRAFAVRTLGDRDGERRKMVEALAMASLEHEREKLALASYSSSGGQVDHGRWENMDCRAGASFSSPSLGSDTSLRRPL
eukprot:TRINITY_DN68270_c0_g1_i1.p1 TRINITY_DN68270_c0_g1~~TRINITY_DN68270_c0_g1_i1.p1  ORF type:complete len:499 (+),score=102.97 TRINITY_DN68270_c0_g1_i1:138-1499(+)